VPRYKVKLVLKGNLRQYQAESVAFQSPSILAKHAEHDVSRLYDDSLSEKQLFGFGGSQKQFCSVTACRIVGSQPHLNVTCYGNEEN